MKLNYKSIQKFFRIKKMGKTFGSPSILPEGTIRVRKNGDQFIKQNGKWVYQKKIKISKPKKTKVPMNYPPIKLPSNIQPHPNYPRYYVSEEGDAYREPGKFDRNGNYGKINEYGLIYLKPAFRGHPKYKEKQYYCVNVSLYNEDGTLKKQIKKSNHQLVAETFVPNPHGYTEIMHLDENNRNNHYTNLKWGTHLENMTGVDSPCTQPKSFKITDTTTGIVYTGINIAQWVRDNWDLILPRLKKDKTKYPRFVSNAFANARCKGGKRYGFKIEF